VSRTDVGIHGEHAFAALHRNQAEIVVPPLSDAVRFSGATTLGQVVNAWLAYIGVASSVETTDNSRDGIGLSALREPGGRAFDLTELGVGVSQVLPVVLTSLMTRPGEVVAIEQPELHLHPALQIRLAEFFIACAKSGRQVLVESHSEYLVNRLRRQVAENPGDRDLIQLLFAEQDESGGTHYRESTIRSDGTLEDDWPSGFLDVGAAEAFQLLKAHLSQESRA
jgi:predicted ATPase